MGIPIHIYETINSPHHVIECVGLLWLFLWRNKGDTATELESLGTSLFCLCHVLFEDKVEGDKQIPGSKPELMDNDCKQIWNFFYCFHFPCHLLSYNLHFYMHIFIFCNNRISFLCCMNTYPCKNTSCVQKVWRLKQYLRRER